VEFVEKILACDAVRVGEPQQFALEADQPLVDVVKLLDQRLDAVLVSDSDLTSATISFLSVLYLRSWPA